MRKVIFFAAFAFLISSSFTTMNNESFIPVFKNQKFMSAEPWQVDLTFVLNDFQWIICNGDEIIFPELTVHMEFHGVENDNMYLVNGSYTFTGTGYNSITGEIYTIDFQMKDSRKVPTVNGATVINSKWVRVITGDRGSKDIAVLKGHTTINAKGEVTSTHFSSNGECQ